MTCFLELAFSHYLGTIIQLKSCKLLLVKFNTHFWGGTQGQSDSLELEMPEGK